MISFLQILCTRKSIMIFFMSFTTVLNCDLENNLVSSFKIVYSNRLEPDSELAKRYERRLSEFIRMLEAHDYEHIAKFFVNTELILDDNRNPRFNRNTALESLRKKLVLHQIFYGEAGTGKVPFLKNRPDAILPAMRNSPLNQFFIRNEDAAISIKATAVEYSIVLICSHQTCKIDYIIGGD